VRLLRLGAPALLRVAPACLRVAPVWLRATPAWLRAAPAGLLFAVALAAQAQQPLEIRLWPEGAPGSENWSVPESITGTDNRIVTNVSDPTLTVYLPDPGTANGAAVVIAPGGALRALAWDSEGVRVAEWLNSKGIAGFVLKYRLLQQGGTRRRSATSGNRHRQCQRQPGTR
jgi:acetyl esterase/lipase